MKVQFKTAQAKRLMRKLDLPSDAGEVITEAKYWSEAFCVLYFDQCDEIVFLDPQAAIPMAEVGLTLVQRVSAEHCNGGAARLRELELRALCVHGSALRAAGALNAADEVYERATRVTGVSGRESANLLGRVAILRKYQRRFGEAEQLISRAIETCERESDGELLGTSLAMRGALYLTMDAFSKALRDLSMALLLIDEKKNPRVFDSAQHNLAGCLYHDQHARLEDLAPTLKTLKKARRKRRPGKTLPKLKLLWLEGLIEAKFGFINRGEHSLRAARKGLVELAVPYEAALVSLDLSLLYLDEGRFDELRRLAAETYRIFKALSVDRDATAALLLWNQAVQGQTLTSEIVVAVRQQVEKQMANPDASGSTGG